MWSESDLFEMSCLPHFSHLNFSASLLDFLLSACTRFSFSLSSHSFLVSHSGSRHILKGRLPEGLTCLMGVLQCSHSFSVDIIMPSRGSGNPTLQPFL